MRVLCEEALSVSPHSSVDIITPTNCLYKGVTSTDTNVVAISIMRAGFIIKACPYSKSKIL